ncbi:MAG: Hpt domain-containing protein [Moraxellaceae bacterium]|nr:Hpt domain-containing protein [Moraxellaceae bacterium]MDZ4297954.1 Hpt domain-containing protein [Moraxellaceae bacterium]MDZ4387588.1 Hpt domain-containing protein [Moraxellaceae bacterium]
MSDDLIHDDEFQEMMRGFAQNFWASRIPDFLQLAQLQTANTAGLELKRAVHGLAGTAEMINEKGIGDLARQAETCWDVSGAQSEITLAAIEALIEFIKQRQALQN